MRNIWRIILIVKISVCLEPNPGVIKSIAAYVFQLP
jgi:hypothetical protein